METFRIHQGTAVPLLLDNIDTDQIIPGGGIFASGSIDHEQCAKSLFADWRFNMDGSENPDFVLNQPRWKGASVLLTGANFGCGSSREWATTALRGFGFRTVIAVGFSNIFFNNCFRNGVLPIEIDRANVEALARATCAATTSPVLTIDLESQLISAAEGVSLPFSVPPVMRRMLLDGADESTYALLHEDAIREFRSQDKLKRGWAYQTASPVANEPPSNPSYEATTPLL